MKVIFPDGSWLIGKRNWKSIGFPPHETKGTHHFLVITASDESLRGKEVAVPINQVKYFILNYTK